MSKDELVYEERDETFGCGVGKSRSKRHILIGCYQTLTTEYHVLDADRPDDPPRCLRAVGLDTSTTSTTMATDSLFGATRAP